MHAHCEQRQEILLLVWMDKDVNKDVVFFFVFFAGKYVEGQTCDPKTWKANFRCAMNSLPDVEEVKDKSINKGHQAMRVFRLLPTTPKSRGEITDRKRAELELTLLLTFSFFSVCARFVLQTQKAV